MGLVPVSSRQPRGKKMAGDGLIRGLRLEPELARAVRAYAVQRAQDHSAVKGETVQPNMAAAARDLMRRGLAGCAVEFHGTGGRDSGYREGYFAGLAEARREMGKVGATLSGAR